MKHVTDNYLVNTECYFQVQVWLNDGFENYFNNEKYLFGRKSLSTYQLYLDTVNQLREVNAEALHILR